MKDKKEIILEKPNKNKMIKSLFSGTAFSLCSGVAEGF